MYGALWRLLPGPWPVRTFVSLAALAGIVVGLFAFVFPAVEPKLPWSKDTVSSSVGSDPAPATSGPSVGWQQPSAAGPSSGLQQPSAAGPSSLPGD